jgi:hypothetical protein
MESSRRLDQYRATPGNSTGPYLLVPAKQYAHSLASTLTSTASVDLRKASGLWGKVARVLCGRGLSHAFVAVSLAVSPARPMWDGATVG